MRKTEKKMIPVTKTFLPSLDDYFEKVKQIWASGWITNNGKLEQDLVASLKEYLQVPNIQLVANGTLALQLAIKALDLTGEIITTPYSYVATTNAIVWEGCIPRFVDVAANTLCLDPDLIEDAINERTSAIMATHVYGYACDVKRIAAIANKHGLKVIYDAAHCFGVKLDDHPLILHGDASILSFHATKLFHSAEGGGVICREEITSNRIHLLKKFGHIGEDYYYGPGINAKLSELHAAMGLCMLPLVDQIIERRKQIVELYDERILNSKLQRPQVTPGLEYNYNYYPILFSSHEHMIKAIDAMLKQNIFPRRYFYPSLNTLEFLQQAGQQKCPVSEDASSRVLCLPLYDDLEKDMVTTISDIVLLANGD
ncbi:DegT/DnrJ/EryC1/StrS family aminotransferase [Chloroflexota bacterium]